MSFPRQELLKESYRLMEIRKLLRSYGIRNFNLSNSSQVMVIWNWWSMWRTTSAVAPFKHPIVSCVSSPDIDKIHPEARPASVFGWLPDISWGIQAPNVADILLVSPPADCSRQGMAIWVDTWMQQMLCVSAILMQRLLCCSQIEECVTLLKKLSSTEAENVIERLTSWARLQLQDKVHISDEVRTGKEKKVICL